MSDLKLIGHRGYGPTHNIDGDDGLTYNTTLPENSLPAFEYVLDSGADGIELDVVLSGDGVPMVIHDQELYLHVEEERTQYTSTVGGPKVSELSADQVKTYNIGGGNSVPTLQEVLELCEEYVDKELIVNMDVKDEACVEPILRAIEQSDRTNNRFVVSSYDWNLLRAFREQSDDVELVPAIKSLLLFGEGNVQMPGHIPLVDYYQDDAREMLQRLYDEIRFSALDCTFPDFKKDLAVWANEMGVGLQISTGNFRIGAKDTDYNALVTLNEVARNSANIPFVLCKVDEPDLVREELNRRISPSYNNDFDIGSP